MIIRAKQSSWYLSWKGLLGTRKPQSTLIKTRFGIHTFGMHYTIDVIILDKKSVIKNMKKNLQPNRFFFWNPLYDTVIELPAKTIEEKKLRKGEKIELQTF